MAYRKVKKIAFQGNSARSMVLRQKCSKKIIELLEQGKRLLFLDESFILDSSMTHSKWRLRNQTNAT